MDTFNAKFRTGFLNLIWLGMFLCSCGGAPAWILAQENNIGAKQNGNAAGAVRTTAERFLFYPAPFPVGDWKPTGFKYSDVEFKSTDGTDLHGWLVESNPEGQIILFCHGNAGNVTFRANRLRHFHECGYNAFVFDYRGYGNSKGVPTIEGVLEDAEAAFRYLQDRYGVDSNDIIIHGRSLGGAVAVQLAAKHPPKALILESTFTSYQDVVKSHLPNAAWLIKKNDLNTLDQVKKIKAPLLISHGDIDNVIPFEHGRTIFEAANRPKIFYRVDGAGHGFSYAKEYNPILEKFIDQLD